ncbi:MAG TPA: GDSL-type esterase/lipase family protein [Patescibacteria group bacterium]|nr:GDSL-type esterase/lipase family protein [Patescibacteria group bacterium]
MTAPDLKGDFSSASGLLMSIIMLFIPGLGGAAAGNNNNGFSIADFFKKIFGFGNTSPARTDSESAPASKPDNTATTQTDPPAKRPAPQNGKMVAYVLGDSLGVEAADGLRLTGQFTSVNSKGAHVGAHLSEITQAQIAAVAPGSTCYISIGTNDVDGKHSWTDAEVNEYVKKVMLKADQVKARGADVVMIGMQPPSKDYNGNKVDVWDANIKKVNRAMEAAAVQHGIKYQSFESFGYHAGDGVHLTEDGQKKMGQVLAGVATPNGPTNA